jgi:hypothetical protein
LQGACNTETHKVVVAIIEAIMPIPLLTRTITSRGRRSLGGLWQEEDTAETKASKMHPAAADMTSGISKS